MKAIALTENARNATSDSSAAAFARAYVEGFPQTIKFLVGKGVNFALAEELAQVAWVRGWEALHQLKLGGSTTAWINTIAYRRLCNHHRRMSRDVILTELQDERVREPSLALDAEILMSRCSPFEQVIMRQRYVDGMDIREIAATQGLSEMAIRLRLHRCRHGLSSIVAGRS